MFWRVPQNLAKRFTPQLPQWPTTTTVFFKPCWHWAAVLVPLLARGPFVMQLGNAMHEQENMNTFYICGMTVCMFFGWTKCMKFDLKHMHGIAQVHLKNLWLYTSFGKRICSGICIHAGTPFDKGFSFDGTRQCQKNQTFKQQNEHSNRNPLTHKHIYWHLYSL